MASFREALEEEDIRGPRTATAAEQPAALMPLHELARGDGYRWASLDGEDLDPPTSLPPY